MSASKDKQRGTWTLYTRYENWKGEKQVLYKRGFKTKKEALEYEREFLQGQTRDMHMTFKTFVEEHYWADIRSSIEDTTYNGKMYRIKTHIMPYFAKKQMATISSADILKWQNELKNKTDRNGKKYSDTYLRSIQNDLNAIFNHAYRYYDLRKIPKEIAEKEIRIYDFLATCTADDFCRMIDSSAFNEIIRAFVKMAVINADIGEENRFRKKMIHIKLSDDEYNTIWQKSLASNLTVSDAIRTLIVFGRIKPDSLDEKSQALVDNLNKLIE